MIAAGLLWLAGPLSPAQAQDDEEEAAEEEGGDIDSMMESDPDRPAAKEGDAEDAGGGDEGEGDDERPPGDGSDDERPPGEASDAAPEEGETAPVVVDDQTKGFELGLLLGYGISLEDGPNLWSAGFGLRAGYDIGLFVIGARFVYYIGGEAEITTYDQFQVPETETVNANIWELSADFALDFALSEKVALRPGLGLGFASASGSGVQSSKLYGAISPGAALLFLPADTFYVGLDARFQVVTTQPEAAKGIVLLAGLGMSF